MNTRTMIALLGVLGLGLVACPPTDPDPPPTTAQLGRYLCTLEDETYYELDPPASVNITSYFYDDEGRITSLLVENWSHGEFRDRFHGAYHYDALGRLTAIDGADGTRSYWYDDDGFRHVEGDPTRDAVLYDEDGRRLEERSLGGRIRIFEYDDLGRFIHSEIVGLKHRVDVSYTLDEDAGEWVVTLISINSDGELQYMTRRYFPSDAPLTKTGSYRHALRSESFEDGEWVENQTSMRYEGHSQINEPPPLEGYDPYRRIATYLDDCGQAPTEFGPLDEDYHPIPPPVPPPTQGPTGLDHNDSDQARDHFHF